MALARKAPSLLALNPDIAVIQECSKKAVDFLNSHGVSGLWFGANPNKGVGVFSCKEFSLQSVDKPFGKWVIPVRVHGAVDFKLLAIWACPVGFTDVSCSTVVGSETHPLSSLGISTAIPNGTRTAPGETTPKWFVYSKSTVSSVPTTLIMERSKEPKLARPTTFTVIRTSHSTLTTYLSRKAGG